jgi:hypothetical protein
MKEFGWFAVIAGVVILEVATAPGGALAGRSWKVSRSHAPGMVHLTLERARLSSHSVTSTDVPLTDFRGFSLSMLDRSGPAKFEYVHEAGRLLCEGRFAWGRGSGSFTLTPNPEFVAQLNRLGFASPDQDDLFTLMLSNITIEYARTIQEAAIGASLRQLIDLRQHGITAAYIRDVNSAGYRNFRAEDYLELRDHGVDSAFLWDLKSAGYHFHTAELVELHTHGVGAQFAGDLKEAGYDLTAAQIEELAVHGVNSGFLREIAADGLHPPVAALVQLHQHGVSPEYLRGLHEAGFDVLSPDDIVMLREHGVASSFAIEARDLGYNFTPGELIQLREHGVDAGYLKRLHDSGMQHLTAPQITQLRQHGVD